MRSSQPAYTSLTRFSCVVLSYSLLLSLCAPFHVRSAAPALGGEIDALAATPLVSYHGHGGIQTSTDTLGRVVTFNYDSNNRPISITQAWNGTTHTWATFGYSDTFVQPGFSGLNVLGPQNQTISVLTQVGFADGTRYNFEYAPSGQVSVIRHYADDGHQLSYIAYDFDASGTDCPRVVERRDFAEDWNDGAEALTAYADEGGGVRAARARGGITYRRLSARAFALSRVLRALIGAGRTGCDGVERAGTESEDERLCRR